MKPGYQSSKLYQADLYDQIRSGKNSIVCLAQEGTKTFILLAAIRNSAYQLHPKYGSKSTIIIEPDEASAAERERILHDHTELLVTNSFRACESSPSINFSVGQVAILSMRDVFEKPIPKDRVNLVILDSAHSLLIQDTNLVHRIVRHFRGVQLLTFMCSLIHNNNELTPINTVNLIRQLEFIFDAKCETSCDLRSLSRQSPVTKMRVLEFNGSAMITCDWYLLVDQLLKQFCDMICDQALDNYKPIVQLEADLSHVSGKTPALSQKKQLVLVRSCIADVLYSMHSLGLWCAKKTIQLYLTEFSRLSYTGAPIGDLISAASTILNCLYGRMEVLEAQHNRDDMIIQASTPQLKSLLEILRESKPQLNSIWPIGIIHVRRRVIAKVIALWLHKVSTSNEEYAFIKPNYIVGSTRKHRNRMAVDNFDLQHETAIRDFRFGNCNVLVTSAVSERCTDIPRCSLVVSFDLPARFSEFIQAKGNCRFDSSKYVVMLNSLVDTKASDKLLNYVNLERLLNNVSKKLVCREAEEAAILDQLEPLYPAFPASGSKNPATLRRSVAIIHKYCTKLPSDSFTKLSPEWTIKEATNDGEKVYYCQIRLPINSPVRQTIVGPPGPTGSIASRLAAFTAARVLYEAGELDENMLPITKETMRIINPFGRPRDAAKSKSSTSGKGSSVGSTKRRQYYKKRIAKVFSSSLIKAGEYCNLYKFKMVLNCPIPDEQNRRGRRIIDPSETNRNYAIVCSTKLPKVCSFPLFTRSGEVFISVELMKEKMILSEKQVEDLRTFHRYTFSKVLKLEKYPIVHDPENSQFTVLLAPVVDLTLRSQIDWDFVDKIVYSDQDNYVPDDKTRSGFEFKHDAYIDAVVIPWYRLTDRQQFAYYVAEICTDLRPTSTFPDKESGFETFIDYYKSKYDIDIYNKDQPILDVDHTSARLNLLTPRYVNRKGRTLPSSTAKTRRESRESLIQKQLLIPELCSIHPFPASFWRKAVCLPCIFYRLNSLYLAEELRRHVASETKVGFVEPSEQFEWPSLNFGWSLKDVVNNRTPDEELATEEPTSKQLTKSVTKVEKKQSKKVKFESALPISPASPEGNGTDFLIDHFDPSKYEIPDIPLDAPMQDWTNIKLISCSSTSSGQAMTGWDQPIEQRDLFLEHTNDISWSDCEMEYEGEITEKVAQMRCGSPSTFEPGTSCLSQDSDLRSPRLLSTKVSLSASKQVRFGNVSSDSLVAFDDGNLNSVTSREMSLRKLSTGAGFDSDSSWSVSDDDNGDTGNSDDDTRYYGEWKDSKSKNQPLLRELFIPNCRSLGGGSLMTDIESIHETMKRSLVVPSATIAEEESLTSCTVDQLEIKRISIPDSDTQKLVAAIQSFTKERLIFCEEDIENSTRAYLNIIQKLDSTVDSCLYQDPNMFKDNGIELIAVDDSFGDTPLDTHPTFGELLPNRDTNIDWPSEDWKNIKFDPIRKELDSNGPGPSVILQALTMSNASDGINLERLETVGDSFLKYSITAYLYCTYPSMHEGKLSYLRSMEISNANLYELGKRKNLGELMSATKFEPNDNWLPPGYTVAESAPVEDRDNNKKREIDKALAEVPYDLLLQHSIPDKSIADCVEALIGAYLTASGSRAALLFMKWLGLRVIPESFNIESDCQKLRSEDPETIWRWLGSPPSPLIVKPLTYDEKALTSLERIDETSLKQNAVEELYRHYYANNLEKFEQDIQYTFKDKAYLVQAFTHNSFHENHVTDCHQRLEFLGDALLDYLITRYLFEDPRCHSPGTLTDLRSALVNNTFFASLAVKYQFHKYLRYISDELFQVIDGFVKKFRFGTRDTITKGYTLLISEGESEYAEDIEVPKALGDVFESVAGAIFLDSGLSLDQVWKVYFRMIKPEIEYFSQNVPKSPIRELLESMPQNVRFSPSELAPDRKHRVIAEVFGLGRFTGVGRSKHSAKSTAAKRALRMLAIKRREQEKLEQSEPHQANPTDQHSGL